MQPPNRPAYDLINDVSALTINAISAYVDYNACSDPDEKEVIRQRRVNAMSNLVKKYFPPDPSDSDQVQAKLLETFLQRADDNYVYPEDEDERYYNNVFYTILTTTHVCAATYAKSGDPVAALYIIETLLPMYKNQARMYTPDTAENIITTTDVEACMHKLSGSDLQL